MIVQNFRRSVLLPGVGIALLMLPLTSGGQAAAGGGVTGTDPCPKGTHCTSSLPSSGTASTATPSPSSVPPSTAGSIGGSIGQVLLVLLGLG